jgi:hypothetical protein
MVEPRFAIFLLFDPRSEPGHATAVTGTPTAIIYEAPISYSTVGNCQCLEKFGTEVIARGAKHKMAVVGIHSFMQSAGCIPSSVQEAGLWTS